MRLSFFVFALLVSIFLIASADAELYKQFEDIKFVEVIRVDGYPSDSILANITVKDPDSILLVGYDPMTYNSLNKTFNYTLTAGKVQKTGTYSKCITASSAGLNQTSCFDFEVTPSGAEQNSILENPFPIFFIGIGLILLIFGIYKGNPWMGFISSVIFIMGGIYTFIYGLNNEQTLYTQSISIVVLGIGLVFMFLSAYEFLAEE